MDSRVIKKILSIIVLSFLCFETTFAVVVSDNDGAAFITKGEFDTLKSNFQNQLNQYNTNIDAKIDQAISSYLAGIKTEKTSELTNIYDVLGGSNIRFGYPNITPTVAPKAGFGIYYINCWKNGYQAVYPGAGYNPIKNPAASEWWTATTNYRGGGGERGNFITYDLQDGKKYLTSYKYGLLEAVYVGGWYRIASVVTSIQNYPFGSAPTTLGQSCTVGSRTNVDCWNSYYRAYTPTDLDLTNWTFSYALNTDSDKISIDNEEYNLPSNYRTEPDFEYKCPGEDPSAWTVPPDMKSSGGTLTNMQTNFLNIRVYDWKYKDDDNYDNFNPGFYKGKRYSNSLYGGVQLLKTDKNDGKVKITNLKFNRQTSGTVFFAINSQPFTNSDSLSGDVTFTKVTGATVDTASQNLYKVTSGTEVSIEFDGKANTTYYIKCQYQKAQTTSNTLYCGIDSGAKITITTEN